MAAFVQAEAGDQPLPSCFLTASTTRTAMATMVSVGGAQPPVVKTALYTLDEGAPAIYRFDIRTREQLPPIRVRGVTMASMLRMGSNNSICY